MKLPSVKQAIAKARQDARLLPVRCYIREAANGNVRVRMPAIKLGTKGKVERVATIPERLFYYSYAVSGEDDEKKSRHGDEPKAVFALMPLGVWDLYFRGFKPGWTWAAPETTKVDPSFHGDQS